MDFPRIIDFVNLIILVITIPMSVYYSGSLRSEEKICMFNVGKITNQFVQLHTHVLCLLNL